MASLPTIFSWFETGDIPTEQQFKETFSSFFHKEANIPFNKVDGLTAAFQNTVAASVFSNYVTGNDLKIASLAKLDASNLSVENKIAWKTALNIQYIATVDSGENLNDGNVYNKVQTDSFIDILHRRDDTAIEQIEGIKGSYMSNIDFLLPNGKIKPEKVTQTLTSIENPTLTGTGLTIFYNDEEGTRQRGVVDLGPLKSSILAEANAGYKGYLKISDPVPTVVGMYRLLEIGTYTNLTPAIDENGSSTDPSGNPVVIKAQANKLNDAYFSGSVWQKKEVVFPEASQNIPRFELIDASKFPLTQGFQVVYNYKFWSVKTSQIVNITDVPAIDSTKWDLIGEELSENKIITTSVKTDSYSTSEYFQEANLFSGFGFTHGVHKDFNQAVIKVGQILGTSKPVTEVNIRICEESYLGTQLAKVTKTVSIAPNEVQDVTFDFATIPNTAGKELWVEFWCNGKTGLFKTGNPTTYSYRYKTTSQVYSDFTGVSSVSAGPNRRFFLELKKTSVVKVLKENLTAGQLLVGEKKPVQTDIVAKEFDKYKTVIVDGFRAESTAVMGNTTTTVQTSTFQGWGQLRGALTNFNRVGTIVRPFDAGFIPTTLRCIIRRGSSTSTDVILDQIKPISVQLNVNKQVYFDLPTTFINTNNDEIYISFIANGRIALVGGTVSSAYDSDHAVKYTSNTNADILTGTVSNLNYQMYVEILKGVIEKQNSDSEIERIRLVLGGFKDPDNMLPTSFYSYPGKQINIFDSNVVIPDFGDNNSGIRLDYNGTRGKQLKRGYRDDSTPVNVNHNLTLTVYKGRKILSNKTVNILSGSNLTGDGQIIDVCVIGDSIFVPEKINGPLNNIFNADAAKVNIINKSRPGWGVTDFAGAGRQLYRINVSGLTTSPGLGSIYSQGASQYKVEEINLDPAGSGYFSVTQWQGSTPPASSGTLTRVSGSGDNTINYSSMTQTPANEFLDPSTGKFGFAYWNSLQTVPFKSNGYVFIGLGTNNFFGLTDVASSEAQAAICLTQLNEMVASIKSYDPTIKIGIFITIPPADQNAFGETYNIGQLSEMYKKTGLLVWQKTLLSAFDNPTSKANGIYLLASHLVIDPEYDFPTITRPVNAENSVMETIATNGVHPSDAGSKKLAWLMAAIIKLFIS